MKAVVELGGFAQAAWHLNRSQSSVSYAVARLQDGLGLALMEFQGRRAVLTEAGRTLLAEAGPLVDDLLRLEERARATAGGEKPSIRLVVDSLFPKARLFHALDILAARHPHVEVGLRETVRQTSPDPAQIPYDIAICMPAPGARYGQRLIEIELIAVVRRDHPLAARRQPLTRATLARHPRVDIRGDGTIPSEADGKTWQVSTVDSAYASVKQGLCFGWLPKDRIEQDLLNGDLIPLPLAAGGTRMVPLDLSFADGDQAAPVVRFLADLLMRT